MQFIIARHNDEGAMAIDPEELLPSKGKPLDLYGLGIGELKERIAALEAEIARCQAMIDKKTQEKAAASQFFKS